MLLYGGSAVSVMQRDYIHSSVASPCSLGESSWSVSISSPFAFGKASNEWENLCHPML